MMKDKISLLEKAKELADVNISQSPAKDASECLDKYWFSIWKDTPAICRAVLAAMDEIERASDDSLKSKSHSTYSDDWWNGLANAYKNSANILRKHLMEEEEE